MYKNFTSDSNTLVNLVLVVARKLDFIHYLTITGLERGVS